MRTYTLLLAFLCMIASFTACTQVNENEITTATLLEEIVDRDRMAQFPDPSYTCRQFSSYDRDAVAPGDISWFANSDRSMFIRTEETEGGTEYVMMDAEGPGAIVRFWMTFAGTDSGKGTLRIYLDGNTEPVISGAAFDIISGG